MSNDLDMHAPRRRSEWLAVLAAFLCGCLLGIGAGHRWGQQEGYDLGRRATNAVNNVNKQ